MKFEVWLICYMRKSQPLVLSSRVTRHLIDYLFYSSQTWSKSLAYPFHDRTLFNNREPSLSDTPNP